jgi:hypothetical protein
MSFRIDKRFMDTRRLNGIKNDCFVEGVENVYGPTETLRAYGETNNAMYIPMAYAVEKLNAAPNRNTEYPQTDYDFHSDRFPFRTDGGRDQEKVFNTARGHLDLYSTTLLSLHCGYGKCLAKDTPVLLHSGEVKPVQDLRVGDLLMGDDSRARCIRSLATGREKMYEISGVGGSYTVNESHILSLRLLHNNTIKRYSGGIQIEWFNHRTFEMERRLFRLCEYSSDLQMIRRAKIVLKSCRSSDIVDIPVTEYLRLPEELRKNLVWYNVGVDFKRRAIKEDPYELGTLLITAIPDEYRLNTRSVRRELMAGILDRNGVSYRYSSELLSQYNEIITGVADLRDSFIDDLVFVARGLGFVTYRCGTNLHLIGDIHEIPLRSCKIAKPARPNVISVSIREVGVGDYYGFTIDGNRRFLLGDFTVTHNTYEGIRLAQSTGLKCGVLAHRGILFDQWVESIEKFTTAKVQIVGTDGELDPDADFYIFNIAYVHKRWCKETKGWVPKKIGIYKNMIGTLIVDEAHIACAAEMSRALIYFSPRYSIALTATPTRKDGMDKVLELYFGRYSLTRIVRIAKDPFVVYRLPTGIKPAFTRNVFGKKDWNSVIKNLIEDSDRNDLILNLIQKFETFNILVLTKRKSHCTFLSKELTKLNISNTVMIGNDKVYDKKARVLLSTYSKLGVGFDDVRLNMLIVACSVTEVEQYAGRLRDGKDKKRVVIDLVDNDPNCLSHWSDRRKWYISRNGCVKNYYQSFPKTAVETAAKPEDEKKEKPKRLARRLT